MKPGTRITFYHPQKVGGRSTHRALLMAVCELNGWSTSRSKETSHRIQSGNAATEGTLKAGPFHLTGPNSFIRASHDWPPVGSDGHFHLIQFREPMARIISHYRMLDVGDCSHPWDKTMDCRPKSWRDFAENCPPFLLERQIDMLVPNTHHPDEAMNVLAHFDHVIFLDRYEEDIATLAQKLDLPTLRPLHYGTSLNRRFTAEKLLADEETCAIIRKRAANEFEFWNRLLEWRVIR